MEWTNEQQRAIETRDTNILLSAAAGSGKTTVLVERVLQLIASGESHIDRMLIVTFTRAASADMRLKLSRELGKRAQAGDERCRQEQLLMERASISTLHGFCSDFLRTHFESAGVDPAFRVLDDAESRRIRDDALDQAIEEAYEAMDEELTALDYARGLKGVRSMAEALLRALNERPDPWAWLERACAPDADTRRAWIAEMVAAAHREIDRALLLSRLAYGHPDCNANYAPALEQDIETLKEIRSIEDYSELYKALMEFKQASPGRKRDAGAIGDEVKTLRGDAKKAIDRIGMRSIELNTALKDVEKLLPEYRALACIAKRAMELEEERKAELSALSYSDLEHRTLRALEDPATAQELREKYDHIFLDEYQDTSDVQEEIISRICRENNRFMVGDVKQSIYRFRQAEPRLFLEKYGEFGQGRGGMLLPLTMNFRSRPAILNFVNHVFKRAMFGGESEILYDELAQLNHGNQNLGGGEVQMHLLENPDEESADEALLEMKTCERQALLIARRIRELMKADPELHYRDFAILTRTKRGVLGKMAAVLMQQGIPAFADGTEEFYDSVEIILMLSLLKLTANRRSDIELIGVLRSPVVGLNVEQLAQIRIACPDVPFVDAAAAYARGEGEVARQLRDFFDMLEKWRLLALCSDLGLLCRRILNESGLYDYMGALPGGIQRQANLDRLVYNAARFDQNVSGALTRFLKHTEKLRERGDGDDAHILGENDDVVRLMTAHKSKGLEFPVVFGAMMNRSYNGRAASEALAVDRDLGLGCLYCDPEIQTRRKTLPQLAIAERARREDRAEELRILYVLLTRAQDRLELVGSVKDAERMFAHWSAMKETPGAAGSYLDVIMPALEDAPQGLCKVTVHGGDALDALEEEEKQEICLPAETDLVDEELERMLLWAYPEEQAAHQPLKLTVTGLLREIQSPDALEPLIERPAFLSETPTRMSGAERGTAYHRAMQCLQLSKLRGLSGRRLTAEIARELDELLACDRLSAAQREAIRPGMIARFLESGIGERLLRAEEVQREWSFNALMRINEALEREEAGQFADEEIMVQGSIDCCFQENGRWILLDYKTDRAEDREALTLRYRNQLRLYALALKRITGMDVGEIHLCLLLAGETLQIPLDGDNDTKVPW